MSADSGGTMKKILVIDDEVEILGVLSEFLSARGYAVATAMDGEEGVRKFDSEKPDLVMCDIKMPKKDGFQFLKEIRQSRKWVPVIIISALTEPANILKGYDFQADYYLTKPLDLNEMLKSVEIMISLAPLRKEQ
jgi:DNA-binding response OmpR family regulator